MGRKRLKRKKKMFDPFLPTLVIGFGIGDLPDRDWKLVHMCILCIMVACQPNDYASFIENV